MVAYGKQVEFLGPVVQNVAYSTGSQTLNITYTAVESIELCNPNGFEVYTFFVRFVVKVINVRMIIYGSHHLYQVKLVCQ